MRVDQKLLAEAWGDRWSERLAGALTRQQVRFVVGEEADRMNLQKIIRDVFDQPAEHRSSDLLLAAIDGHQFVSLAAELAKRFPTSYLFVNNDPHTAAPVSLTLLHTPVSATDIQIGGMGNHWFGVADKALLQTHVPKLPQPEGGDGGDIFRLFEEQLRKHGLVLDLVPVWKNHTQMVLKITLANPVLTEYPLVPTQRDTAILVQRGGQLLAVERKLFADGHPWEIAATENVAVARTPKLADGHWRQSTEFVACEDQVAVDIGTNGRVESLVLVDGAPQAVSQRLAHWLTQSIVSLRPRDSSAMQEYLSRALVQFAHLVQKEAQQDPRLRDLLEAEGNPYAQASMIWAVQLSNQLQILLVGDCNAKFFRQGQCIESMRVAQSSEPLACKSPIFLPMTRQTFFVHQAVSVMPGDRAVFYSDGVEQVSLGRAHSKQELPDHVFCNGNPAQVATALMQVRYYEDDATCAVADF